MRFTKASELLDEPNEELDEDEVKIEVNGDEYTEDEDEIITEEYEPDFDDDEFYHQCNRHEDFGYRPFGCGDLL